MTAAQGAVSRDPQLGNLPGLSQYQTQAAALTGHLVADTLLYPLETVLHRPHLQGTRSIIDNLDSGIEVTPILTRYEGVADCFSTILQEEGISGLFKGFGSVLLQYAVHFLIIKFSSKIISQVAQLFSNPPNFLPDPRPPGAETLPPSQSAGNNEPSGDVRSSPRLSKDVMMSPSAVRRHLSSGLGFTRDKPPVSGPTETVDGHLSQPPNKKSLNEIKEGNETGATLKYSAF